MIIALDGVSLSDQVYEKCDVATLETLLQDAIGQLGEVDGSEYGPETTQVFLYGLDAESIFKAIEPVLLEYPLCAGARITLRAGPPGAAEREVQVPR